MKIEHVKCDISGYYLKAVHNGKEILLEFLVSCLHPNEVDRTKAELYFKKHKELYTNYFKLWQEDKK